MEFRELIKAVKKEKKTIIGLALVGLFLGAIAYFVPPKYTTTGSLLVGRRIDPSSKFFTYEGNYKKEAKT